MPAYYPMGKTLVTYDELVEKAATGQLQEFTAGIMAGKKAASIPFDFGTVNAADVLEAAADAVPWTEIGPNKPLTIEIFHAYTGHHKKRPMLVTSAIKSSATFDAAPRAVNLLTKDVESGESISAVPAADKGTFLMYYSPAVMDRQLNLQIDMAFNNFDEALFQTVGDMFQSAAKIPLFAPASGILVAVGLVTKLVSKVANAILDRSPAFSEEDAIRINKPGHAIPEPGYRLLAPNAFGPQELKSLDYKEGVLVDGNGSPYAGPHPYVVLSLDGTTNDKLKEFAPTAASAALLQKFLSVSEGSEVATGALLDALKLASDVKFRREAEAVGAQMKGMDPNSKEYKQLLEQFNALVTSIQNEDLKLKLGS